MRNTKANSQNSMRVCVSVCGYVCAFSRPECVKQLFTDRANAIMERHLQNIHRGKREVTPLRKGRAEELIRQPAGHRLVPLPRRDSENRVLSRDKHAEHRLSP